MGGGRGLLWVSDAPHPPCQLALEPAERGFINAVPTLGKSYFLKKEPRHSYCLAALETSELMCWGSGIRIPNLSLRVYNWLPYCSCLQRWQISYRFLHGCAVRGCQSWLLIGQGPFAATCLLPPLRRVEKKRVCKPV